MSRFLTRRRSPTMRDFNEHRARWTSTRRTPKRPSSLASSATKMTLRP
jgi:hypothetical protein